MLTDQTAVALAPGLRVSLTEKVVEIDGTVPLDVHNPATPDVYLELVACSPDTREHESLVVTTVQPSLIHAALLSIGLDPGEPGRIEATREGVLRIDATGSPIQVELVWTDETGRLRSAAPAEWIRAESGEPMPRFSWVFAGSRVRERGGRAVYDADGTGVVVGLTTFGSEVVAPTITRSPDSGTDAPIWLAENDAVPLAGTPVTIRVTPLVD